MLEKAALQSCEAGTGQAQQAHTLILEIVEAGFGNILAAAGLGGLMNWSVLSAFAAAD